MAKQSFKAQLRNRIANDKTDLATVMDVAINTSDTISPAKQEIANAQQAQQAGMVINDFNTIATTSNSLVLDSQAIAPVTPITNLSSSPLPTSSGVLDTMAPEIIHTSLDDNPAGFDKTSDISIIFNESIQLGSGAIEIHKASDNSVVESFKNGVGSAGGALTISKSNLNINPGADLASDTQYYLTFSDGVIKDLVGNKLPEINVKDPITFSTLPPDTQAPQLLPASDQVNSGVGVLVLKFNEGVKLANGRIEIHNAADNSLVEVIDTQLDASAPLLTVSGSKLNISMTSAVLPTTQYYVTMSSGTVTDLSGNAFAGLSTANAYDFTLGTTINTTIPEIQGISLLSPYSQESDLTVVFNNEIKLGSGDIVLHNTADGSVIETFHNGMGSLGGTLFVNYNALTINPGPTLDFNVKYSLSFSADAVTDSNGNSIAIDAHSDVLTFSGPVPDLQAPNFIGVSAANVTMDGTLKVTQIPLMFDENVKLGTGTITLHNADGSVVETFTNGVGSADGYVTRPFNVTMNLDNSAILMTTYVPLQNGADYYVTLDNNAITDTVGNAFVGITDPAVAHFTQQPWNSYVDPGSLPLHLLQGIDNQIGVLGSADIALNFNKAVVVGQGAIVLHNADDGSIVETFTNGVGSAGGSIIVGPSNGTATKAGLNINPAADLAPATQYYLTMDNGAVVSTDGEAIKGFADTETLNFFTGAADMVAPQLVSSSLPSDNIISTDASIALFFSEPVKIGAGSIELRKVADNSLVESFVAGVGSAGGNVMVIGPHIVLNPGSKLDGLTQYYLSVTDHAITDITGNAVTPLDLSLTTSADTQAPTLAWADFNNLPLSDNLTLDFSENVQLGDGNIVLHNATDGSVVESFSNGVGSSGGQVTVDNAHLGTGSKASQLRHSVIIDPAADLAPETQYYLTFDSHAVNDMSGNTFSAAPMYSGALSFTSFSPGPLAGGVYLDSQAPTADLILDFTASILLGTGDIVLHKASDDSVIETFTNGSGSAGGAVTVAASNASIRINPAANLEPNTEYYLTIDKGAITDTLGTAYAGNSSKARLLFSSNPLDNTAPELTWASPADNQTHVALGADLILGFNEPVQLGHGNIELHKVSDGTIVETFINGVGSAGGSVSSSGIYGNVALVINPANDLQLDSQYYFTVAPDAIEDLWGNAYHGLSNPNQLNFKTTADLALISGTNGFGMVNYAMSMLTPVPPPVSADGGIELVGVHDHLTTVF